MLITKIRTTIIASAAVAALSIPGAASAATLVRSPITRTPVVKPATTTVAKEAGSAGVPGYTDKKCESLLNTYEQNRGAAENYIGYGDLATGLATAEYAGTVKQELENNCLVVD
jgi:hypothetical protein